MLELVARANLYPLQNRCALTYHVWDGQWCCFSAKSWAGLPPALQATVAEVLDAHALKQRDDTLTVERQRRADLKARGMEFDAVDTASFRAALRSAAYYARLRERQAPQLWELLERYTGRLT